MLWLFAAALSGESKFFWRDAKGGQPPHGAPDWTLESSMLSGGFGCDVSSAHPPAARCPHCAARTEITGCGGFISYK